jgi:hypothetical protein
MGDRMKSKITGFLVGLGLATSVAFAATFNLFSPATGVLKGNASTYITSAAASSDIRTMWSGTCDITTFLRGDGACALIGLTTNVTGTLPVANGGTNLAASADDNIMIGNGTTWQTKAVPTCTDTGGNHLNYDPSTNTVSCGTSGNITFANPTASLGLTAINGVAATAMRSDAAPALDQTIAPTWTGTHIFANGTAQEILRNTGAGADAKNVVVSVNSSGTFRVSTATDAAPTTALRNYLNFNRSGSAASAMSFGNATDNPNFIFLGTGGATFSGNITASGSAPSILNNGSGAATKNIFGLQDTGTTEGSLCLSLAAGQCIVGDSADNLAIVAAVSPLRFSVDNGASSTATLTSGAVMNLKAGGDYQINGVSIVGSTTFANPTASLGLTAINGAATTAMRSDAAPALSQSIAPTWSAQHIFTGAVSGVATTGVLPGTRSSLADLWHVRSGAAADNRVWEEITLSGPERISFRALNDAASSNANWLEVTRGSGAAISDLSFGNTTNNPTYSFLGSGGTTFSGNPLVTKSSPRFTLNDSGTFAALVGFQASGVDKGFTGAVNAVNQCITGSIAGDMCVRAESGRIILSGDGGLTLAGSMTSAGVLNVKTGGDFQINGTSVVQKVAYGVFNGTAGACTQTVGTTALKNASCARAGAGNYNVTLSAGFVGFPVCVATDYTGIRIMTVTATATTTAVVGAQTAAGVPTDTIFNLYCTGA